MSCTTLYAVHGADGWAFRAEKFGLVDVSSPQAVLERLRGLNPALELGGWMCRGQLIDEARRLVRFHSCHHELSQAGLREWERAVQASAAWKGWDVRFAWGGHAELSQRAGTAVEPLPVAEAVPLAALQSSHCRYDALAHLLDFDEEPVEYARFNDKLCLVSVVDSDGHARHHAVAADEQPAAGILAMGPDLVNALSDATVWPVIEEVSSSWGVLIDTPRREVGFWGIRCTPAQVEQLAQRHPGWTVVRLVEGYADQLARSGVDPAPWCLGAGLPWPDGELPPALDSASVRRPMPTVTAGVVPCTQVGHSIGWDWLS